MKLDSFFRSRIPAAVICTLIGVTPVAARPHGQSAEGPQGKTEDRMFPTGANWILAELNGRRLSGDSPSLTIDVNFRGSGYSGCNTFSATLYPVRGMRLAMGPVAMTRKMCDAGRMGLVRAYLSILHSGPAWSVEGSDLLVKGSTGTLRFKRGL